MSGIGAAIGTLVGGSAITGLLSANAQSNAAQQAAAAQTLANQKALSAAGQGYNQGVAQQGTALASGTAAAGAQNNSLQQLLAPFIAAGAPGISGLQNYATQGQNALGQQSALAGSDGSAAQLAAVNGIQNSPTFQALLQQQNQGVLQNASATGGLRSGTTNSALAQLDPALLNNQIQLQLQNLGTLSSQGSAASSALAQLGSGAAGTQAQGTQQTLASLLGLTGQTAGNLANLSSAYTGAATGLTNQQGAIGAGLANAQGQGQQNLFNGIGSSLNQLGLLGALGKLGGTAPTTTSGLLGSNYTLPAVSTVGSFGL